MQTQDWAPKPPASEPRIATHTHHPAMKGSRASICQGEEPVRDKATFKENKTQTHTKQKKNSTGFPLQPLTRGFSGRRAK